MGSRQLNGQPITQTNNVIRTHHQGELLKTQNTLFDSVIDIIPSSGTLDITPLGAGVVRTPGGLNTTTSGLSLEIRKADNSVEIQKYTVDGTTSGNLGWEYTRKIDGIHTSISALESAPKVGNPSNTVTERKVFFLDSDRGAASGLAAWTIFDSSGNAVGATDGTTDTDITPDATFNIGIMSMTLSNKVFTLCSIAS